MKRRENERIDRIDRQQPLALADDTGLDPFTTHVARMTDKDGMVSKKSFLAMMEKRFDMMDKKKIGRISRADAMRSFRTSLDLFPSSLRTRLRRWSRPGQRLAG